MLLQQSVWRRRIWCWVCSDVCSRMPADVWCWFRRRPDDDPQLPHGELRSLSNRRVLRSGWPGRRGDARIVRHGRAPIEPGSNLLSPGRRPPDSSTATRSTNNWSVRSSRSRPPIVRAIDQGHVQYRYGKKCKSESMRCAEQRAGNAARPSTHSDAMLRIRGFSELSSPSPVVPSSWIVYR